ncbi:MAG TPA: LPS assembly lipoprotein LptE [Methylophilaceae bacterium]|nr:LPS assembly lipoprotein LptE [Methylophilaceae bacterium]
MQMLHAVAVKSLLVAGMASMLLLSGCGFEMRGKADLSFKTIFIQGPNYTVSRDLRKALDVNGVAIVNDPEKADLLLDIMSEVYDKRILSLSGRGRVTEYELIYNLNFRIKNAANAVWGPVQTVEGRRDFSYDDTQVLAKSYEEARLRQDMQSDAVREIMRRLTAAQKPSA